MIRDGHDPAEKYSAEAQRERIAKLINDGNGRREQDEPEGRYGEENPPIDGEIVGRFGRARREFNNLLDRWEALPQPQKTIVTVGVGLVLTVPATVLLNEGIDLGSAIVNRGRDAVLAGADAIHAFPDTFAQTVVKAAWDIPGWVVDGVACGVRVIRLAHEKNYDAITMHDLVKGTVSLYGPVLTGAVVGVRRGMARLRGARQEKAQ